MQFGRGALGRRAAVLPGDRLGGGEGEVDDMGRAAPAIAFPPVPDGNEDVGGGDDPLADRDISFILLLTVAGKSEQGVGHR